MAKRKTQDANDLLGDLNNIAGDSKPKQEAPKASDRPELTLLKETQELLAELSGVSAVEKIVTARKDALQEEFKTDAWEQFTESWYKAGGRPKNPSVNTKRHDGKPDCSGILQIKAQFKVNAPEDGKAVDALIAVGFNKKLAEKIVEENVDEVVETGYRNFNDLVKGRYISGKGGRQWVDSTDIEKSAGTKLMKFTMGQESEALTTEERQVALVQTTKTVVKAGFMERAATYCEDVDELRALLTVIKPTTAMSHLKFAKSESEEGRTERLKEVFNDLVSKSDVS